MTVRPYNTMGNTPGFGLRVAGENYVAGAPAFIVDAAADVDNYPAGADANDFAPLSVSASSGILIGILDDQTNTVDNAATQNVSGVARDGVSQTAQGASNVILPGVATHAASRRVTFWTYGIFATDQYEALDRRTASMGACATATAGAWEIPTSAGVAATATKAQFLGFRVPGNLEDRGFAALSSSLMDAGLEGLDSSVGGVRVPTVFALLKIS